MADQGASQRRGTESSVTQIGQTNTLFPPESFGTSYFEIAAGTATSNDVPSFGSRARETRQTQIGVANEVPGTQGTAYTNQSLGTVDSHDTNAFPSRQKETGVTPVGSADPETPNHGTSYNESTLGSATPIGGGGGATVTTYYKLRAKDTGASYVEWVTTTTPLTVGSYPGTPVGTLVDLTVLSIVTH